MPQELLLIVDKGSIVIEKEIPTTKVVSGETVNDYSQSVNNFFEGIRKMEKIDG